MADRPTQYSPKLEAIRGRGGCFAFGVRGGDDEFPVQLCYGEDDRVVIRAINEGGFSCVDIDAEDFFRWLAFVGVGIDAAAAIAAVPLGNRAYGYEQGHPGAAVLSRSNGSFNDT